jgi:threonine/homoserine/homoserine lactone efflux protein
VTASLLAAALALALLTVLPGPDVAVVTRVAVARGRAAGIRAAQGVVTGLLAWGLLTGAGLAALLAASPSWYTALQLAGAGYLGWLGAQALWSARRRDPPAGEAAAARDRLFRPFRTGLLTNLLNPKIAVFYTGLLPSLVPERAPHLAALTALVALHAVLSVLWLSACAAAVTRAAGALQRPRVQQALERVTGVVLLGLAARVVSGAASG